MNGDEMWDDPEAAVEDSDELAPTLKVTPFPYMTFEERLAHDQRQVELRFRRMSELAA